MTNTRRQPVTRGWTVGLMIFLGIVVGVDRAYSSNVVTTSDDGTAGQCRIIEANFQICVTT